MLSFTSSIFIRYVSTLRWFILTAAIFVISSCEMPHPEERPWPLPMRMSHPGLNLLFQQERGWQFPLQENALGTSLKWLLVGLV